MSPVADLSTLKAFHRVLKRIRPAAVLTYTIKPNIYASIAARTLGIPVINNVSGLGIVFTRETMLTRLVERLYRFALTRSATVFFQNRDDAALFAKRRIVRQAQTQILPGSGVDLSQFKPSDAPLGPQFTFLFAGRLLWAKGLGELAQATRKLKASGGEIRVRIAGIVAGDDRDAVPLDQLQTWADEGVIDFLGPVDDIRPLIAEADCVLLPSYYREGVPRALLEAAASARPVITTDWPGCREALDDGVTGFLCQPRSSDSLADAMRRMMNLEPAERQAMGREGRTKMEREFSEELVIRAYLDALGEFASSRS
jgi:glycosyltransferase involved in cell wall biosynthesis